MKHTYQIVVGFIAMLLLCLSMATPSNALKINMLFEAAEQVPASIHSAMSGGFWTAGKDEGFSVLSLSRAASNMCGTVSISNG